MAIIGWIVLVIFLFYWSMGVWLLLLNNLGTYNIGGAVNSFTTKLYTVLLLLLVCYFWFLLFYNIPFKISLS